MLKTRRLLREDITYSAAKDKEVNILHRLTYHDQKTQFFGLLNSKRSWVSAIVAHHLNLQSSDACQVADIGDWPHGSFNVCGPSHDC